MPIVFASELVLEAELVRSSLQAAGIPAQVLSAGLPGASPIDARHRVLVPDAFAEEADELLGNNLRRDALGRLSLFDPDDEEGRLSLTEGDRALSLAEARPEPDACPACGSPWEPGFEVCWNCQHELS